MLAELESVNTLENVFFLLVNVVWSIDIRCGDEPDFVTFNIYMKYNINF